MALAISEHPATNLSDLQPLWHHTAPRRVVEKCPDNDPLLGWTAWRKYLAQRKHPTAPPFLRGERPPMLWAWPKDSGLLDETQSRITLVNLEELVATALSEPAALGQIDVQRSLHMVALAYALPELSGELSADIWWQLVSRLRQLAAAASLERAPWPGDPHVVLRGQLLAGELPLALSYVLPEVRVLRDQREVGQETLTESLLALTDGQGLPHARLLPVVAPLLACWTRARWVGDRLKRGAWSNDAEVQYEWLVQHALRLLDGEGRLMLVPGGDDAAQSLPKELVVTALRLVGDRQSRAAAAEVFPTRKKERRPSGRNLPERSLESEWSGIAVLASGWSRSATRLALAFVDDPVRIELEVGREKLLLGDWQFEATCDGEPAQAVDEWEQLSWETDKRFDYIELGVELTAGLRLERQLLLAHDDAVLYLCDTVLTTDGAPHRLQHSMRLPLADNVAWQAEIETRDGLLVSGKRRAAVLPLALHEWRSDPRGGSLVENAGRLVLTQETTGRAVCCPLVVDLKPRRSRQERTWRQVTVAESLQVVPRDVAMGFRAQSGRDQWVFYRSLGPAGNRSLLGYNIAGEFAAGRLLSTGKVKDWIEVEAV